MTWKIIFATGAFGGVAPILLQLAIDLTQGRKRIEAIGLSILVGMAIYALLGGGLSLVWKETDLKKVFYIGLGLPSLLTIASANITTPQQPKNPIIPAPTMSVPQQAPESTGSSLPDTKLPVLGTFASISWLVYAQTNIADRQLSVDLDPKAVPSEVTQSPLNLIFEPGGGYAPVQYGKAIVNVPPTATSFRIEGTLASSSSVELPTTSGSTTRVRFGAEKRSWYGLLYSLGVRRPPYQLVKISSESSVPVTDPKDSIVGQFQLKANAKPLKTKNGSNRYEFSVSIAVPSALKANIAKVDYDLIYGPNSLLLTSNNPNTNFEAIYEGWGCYSNVGVTVNLKNGESPRRKTFNMCSVLGW